MSFDGFVTGAVARELSEKLTGGKIEKVYQPEMDEITLHIHAGREKYKLLVSSGSSHCRVHFTTLPENNPQVPPSFCMLLRKHLQGGRIASVEQVSSERIIEISVDNINEMGFSVNKKLVIEIMGKHSNIILLDIAENRILDSIKRVSIDVSRYRQVLPGMQYAYPPDQEKICGYDVTLERTAELVSQRPDLKKGLVSVIQGVSPALAEEILFRAERAGFSLAHPDAALLHSQLVSVSQQILKDAPAAYVYLNEAGDPVDFHAVPFTVYEGALESKAFDSISEAAEYYYSHRSSSNRIKQKSSDLERTLNAALDKLYLKKQRLLEDLQKAQDSDSYRLYGELLTASLHAIKPGAENATVLNYYDGQEITIPLDPRFSAAKNAQRYYKKFGKAKTAIHEKGAQLEDVDKDILYLESVLAHLQTAATMEDIEDIRTELTEEGYLKKRKVAGKPVRYKPTPLKYTTSDGFTVYVGKNNKENDILTFQRADKKDIWFHTKDIPGSHVILITDGKEPTETALFESAALAAYHSKGQSSENVPVDYVPIRYVKKPGGAKPGMVIFTNNRTLYVNPKKRPE